MYACMNEREREKERDRRKKLKARKEGRRPGFEYLRLRFCTNVDELDAGGKRASEGLT